MRSARGMTLVELLVVVSIVVVLTAAMLPLMQPLQQRGRIRAAAQRVKSLFAAAQTSAWANGRPAGVLIERAANNPNAAFRLRLAESPLPYAGDFVNSRVSISNIGAASNANFVGGCCGRVPALVHPGDFIRLNYMGPLYQIDNVTAAFLTFRHAGAAAPAETRVPFQIIRQPRASLAAPVELPLSTAIDLANSGIGRGADFSLGVKKVLITFRPGGGLDRCYYDAGDFGTLIERPLKAINLLIGQTDQIGSRNLADSSNLWVTIGRRGSVTSAPNSHTTNRL